MARKNTYKPLLLTTTVRNPERYKILLNVLLTYNGKILTNEIIDKERDINKMPKELQLFAEAWKDKTDFSIDMSKCGNSPLAYYIKSAEVTFKYKDKWYQFTPDNFGTSNEVFDRVCCGREMREALKRLGAEKVFQTSVLD